MNPVYLFDLASRHASWATARQAVITGNIANANTTGYEALEIQRFSDVMDQTSLTMASTEPGHLGAGGPNDSTDAASAARSWEVKSTGNPVGIEEQMLKADQVNRAFSLDMSVVRAFHRMLLTSVRTNG